ncbi:MAG: P-loop NTPase [Campylobacteraceae bacterium]|nr:P-loop NTPase [Campylobacteraceae bacterium]
MLGNQASSLEEIVKSKEENSSVHIITVTSGKGGVGKSTFSANLANILSGYGYKVGIFDADIGLANLDIILNVKTRQNILHVLKGDCLLEDIIVPISKNLVLIPGASGDEILNYSDELILDKFFKQNSILDDLDFIIIDTGAGIGGSIQLFLQASDEVIVVSVPDPAAITDSYALIKIGSKVRNSFSMVFNMVKTHKEAEVIFEQIKKIAHLNISKDLSLGLLGQILHDKIVSKSIKQRTLFTDDFPSSTSTNDIHKIAEKLVFKLKQQKIENKSSYGFSGFFRRLAEQF